jgi:hypothetical protein
MAVAKSPDEAKAQAEKAQKAPKKHLSDLQSDFGGDNPTYYISLMTFLIISSVYLTVLPSSAVYKYSIVVSLS